jgi:hypothetical protein
MRPSATAPDSKLGRHSQSQEAIADSLSSVSKGTNARDLAARRRTERQGVEQPVVRHYPVLLEVVAFNGLSELQRYRWKRQPQNAGRLYTGGLFAYARHINYFGDQELFTG